jgi:hypothetical protein
VDLCGHSMALKALEVVCQGSFFPAFSHAFVVYFLDNTTLVEMIWNLSFIFIFIFFMDKDVEHFFMYAVGICTSSFVYGLFNSFPHLLIALFVLLVCIM